MSTIDKLKVAGLIIITLLLINIPCILYIQVELIRDVLTLLGPINFILGGIYIYGIAQLMDVVYRKLKTR